MEDTIYLKMRSYAIQLLKFEKSMVKIRNNEETFQHYSKELIINWTLKRLNTNHKDGWNDFNILKEDVIYKANKLDEWIMEKYKSKEYLKEYHKEYYQNVLKLKRGGRGYLGIKDRAIKIAENKTIKNTKLVKFAIGLCKHLDEKPTITNLMKYSKLSKPTVIKYKKILMPKKPKV